MNEEQGEAVLAFLVIFLGVVVLITYPILIPLFIVALAFKGE